MPAPRDESANDLSSLQKQLILSQVQILELEDVRDELQALVADRTKVVTELQAVADQALRESEAASRAEGTARAKIAAISEERRELQLRLDSLVRQAELSALQLAALQSTLEREKLSAAKQAARIETLDAELRIMKGSRSWRWTGLLRSLERLFR